MASDVRRRSRAADLVGVTACARLALAKAPEKLHTHACLANVNGRRFDAPYRLEVNIIASITFPPAPAAGFAGRGSP